ncbi:putative bifunctional diguanylate cyclase/phosphodiesterase [Comamonas terrae]|uniref:Bifunctional diguanylate cyclase/phosphodiesterase n=1 Tax=Comamonas terrae TaxID=673548 RepID=A0ABW5UNM0_9BURK|nr:GGDEF domain-containing phosphodiesterase [Comamonas terrae]
MSFLALGQPWMARFLWIAAVALAWAWGPGQALAGDLAASGAAGLIEKQVLVRERIGLLQWPVLTWLERALPYLLTALAASGLAVFAWSWRRWRRRSSFFARLRRSTRGWRESDARFQALYEQAALGVVQVDTASLRIMAVNQRYCAMSGYSAQELHQRKALDLSIPEDREHSAQLLHALVSGQIKAIHGEHSLLRKDGQTVWVEVNISVVGQRPRMLLALVQDISERKRLQQIQQQGHRQLRHLMQRLPVGLVMERNDGRFAYWNDEFLRIAGNPQAPDTHSQQWWSRVFANEAQRKRAMLRWEDAKARVRARAVTVHNGDAPPPDTYTIAAQELSFHGADGTRRTVSMSGVLLDDGCLMVLQDQSQRKAAEDEARRLAFYDPLTALPNRRLLMDRLQQALSSCQRRQHWGGVLLLDIDNFKAFNETMGLEHGDALLQELSQRLGHRMGAGVTVARQGGDDFVIVLDDLGADAVAAATYLEKQAQRVLALVREPLTVAGTPRQVTASLGLSLFGAEPVTASAKPLSAKEVLRRAEMAMYQAKNQGRNAAQFFDPTLQAALQERRSLEQEMRTGLAQRQFELFYQPQVEHGQVVGAEGLLRWRHPRRGFVSPGEFIALAEETGLIVELGEWVLHAACRQLAAWARHPRLAQLTLAINVSAKQFYRPEFVQQVLRALAEHGADPRLLKLELTESLLLSDVDNTIAKMAQLQVHGIGFSLDDFGTGYSSLAYLKRLPLNQLKIDRSFVHDVLTDPNDAAIARTIVALANSLGLRVMAEGVETQAQCQFLEVIGCFAWQGYLMSAPVPVAQFEELVLRGSTLALAAPARSHAQCSLAFPDPNAAQ